MTLVVVAKFVIAPEEVFVVRVQPLNLMISARVSVPERTDILLCRVS